MGANGLPRKPDWINDLLDRHEAGLFRYAHRITRCHERALEVVQDTFLKLAQRDPEELSGHETEWLYTVCRNRALDVRRKERRMSSMTESVVVESAGRERDPEEIAETREEVAQIVDWLGELPENQEEVVRLRFQGGLTYRQIGEVTGLSVSNVGFLLHRGMTTLRERMRRADSGAAYPRLARTSSERA